MITNIFPFIHPIDTAENQSLVSNIKFSFLSYVVLNWMGHIYISRIACFSTIRTHPYIKRNYFSINLIFAYSLSRFYLFLSKEINFSVFFLDNYMSIRIHHLQIHKKKDTFMIHAYTYAYAGWLWFKIVTLICNWIKEASQIFLYSPNVYQINIWIYFPVNE